MLTFYINDNCLGNSEIEECIRDGRFVEYLETMDKAIIYWNERLPGFKEQDLLGVSRDFYPLENS